MGIFDKLFGEKKTENNSQTSPETKTVQLEKGDNKTIVTIGAHHSLYMPKDDKTKHFSDSQNNIFSAGPLTVEAQMWECFFNNEKRSVEILRKDIMGTIQLNVLISDGIEDVIWKAIQIVTKDLLPDHIKLRNLHQFMPTKRPSWDKRGNIIEICYYHSVNSYKEKWGELDNTGYVMQPNDPESLSKLENLCKLYNLEPPDYI